MADSSFDLFVDTIEDQLNDATVLFLQGKTGKAHGLRDRKRRISFERSNGVVKFSSAPSQGTQPIKMVRHVREERINTTIWAEDEDTLDQLFDNLLNAIFECMGPNAFVAENSYEWGGEDSKGGAHVVRQPVILFQLIIRLRVSPPTPLKVTLEDDTLNFQIGV